MEMPERFKIVKRESVWSGEGGGEGGKGINRPEKGEKKKNLCCRNVRNIAGNQSLNQNVMLQISIRTPPRFHFLQEK